MRNMGVAYVCTFPRPGGNHNSFDWSCTLFTQFIQVTFCAQRRCGVPQRKCDALFDVANLLREMLLLEFIFLFLLAMILRIKRYYVIFFGLAGQVVFINARRDFLWATTVGMTNNNNDATIYSLEQTSKSNISTALIVFQFCHYCCPLLLLWLLLLLFVVQLRVLNPRRMPD